MRGKKELTQKMFYQFSLEQNVPENHLLRRLDAILNLDFIYQKTEGLYGYNGNVSVDPVVVKILLLGFLNNITSIREVMRQIEDRMSFRWFLGYDIDEKIPDHSAISKNLARFDPALFEELFDRILDKCIRCGLVGGSLVHIDSSVIKADASEDSFKPKPPEDGFHPDIAPKEYWAGIKAEAKKAGKNVNDYLESTTDPDAGIYSYDGNNRQLAYKDHRAVDDKHGVILSTQATGAEVTDEAHFKSVLDEVLWEHGIVPEKVAADRIYGDVEVYKELINQGIAPCINRKSAAHKKGIYSKEQFTYLPEEDCYLCPEGHKLTPQGRTNDYNSYRASIKACRDCPKRKHCAAGKEPRTVRRHPDEGYVEQALSHKDEPWFKQALTRRMTVVEGSFADAKENRAHRKARWRGLVKMQIQCHPVSSVQNLRKLLQYAGKYVENGAKTLESLRNLLKFVLQRAKLRLFETEIGFLNRYFHYCRFI